MNACRVGRNTALLIVLLLAGMSVGGLRPRNARADAGGQPPVTIGPVSAAFYPNPHNSGAFDPGVLGGGPAFTQQFPEIDFNPPGSAQVTCSSGTGVNEYTRPFSDVVQYSDGSCGTIATQAGIGSMYSFQMVATANLVVAAAGQVTFNFFSDDGWILGAGPRVGGSEQPAYVSGEDANPPAASEVQGYRVVGSYNQPSSPAQNTVTVSFPAAGTYPIEVDYTECCGGQLALTLGTSYGNPIPPTTAPPPPAPFIDCPSAGGTLPTHFDAVRAPAPLESVKRYDIIYEPLDLTWTSQSPSSSVLGQPSSCQLTSNSGVLHVTVDLQVPVGPITVHVHVPAATSTASAMLNYFQYPASAGPGQCDWSVLASIVTIPIVPWPSSAQDCVISNGMPLPGDHMVQWHTDGFTFRGPFGITLYQTPPLTYYVDLDQIQTILPVSPNDVSADLNDVEFFIHRTLIQHLPAVDRVALIQDPPGNVLVRNPDGLVTGKTPAGNVVTQIPQSTYVDTPAGGAVLIVNPKDGAYGVQVNGTPNDAYYLSMSTLNFKPDGLHPTGQATIDQRNLNAGGIQTTCYPIGVVASCPVPSTAPFTFFPSTAGVALKGEQDSNNTGLKIDATSDASGVAAGSMTAHDTRSGVAGTPASITDGTVQALQCTGSNQALAYGSATFNGSPIYFATWVTAHVVPNPATPQQNTFRLLTSNGYDSGAITAPAMKLSGC